MEPKYRLLVTIMIGAALLTSFYLITGAITKYTGYLVSGEKSHNDFELCLEEQDITLYINTKDSTITLRKIHLADYLRVASIVNCFENNQVCIDNNVNSFPTWVINEERVEKDISLLELSKFSDCKK